MTNIESNPGLEHARATFMAHSIMADEGCPQPIPAEVFKNYEEAESIANLNRLVTKAVTLTGPDNAIAAAAGKGRLDVIGQANKLASDTSIIDGAPRGRSPMGGEQAARGRLLR